MAQQGYRVNEDIKAREVRVIGDDGAQVGILPIDKALKLAREKQLDLVEIAPQAQPPVCKIINYGKFQYEQQKKEKIAKKKQHVTVLKEIRLHPNTDTHDFMFKARHARKFLQQGNKVKASVIFKGREMAYTEIGRDLLKKFIEELSEDSKLEGDIKFEGRIMHAILAPQKVKGKKN